MNLPTGWKIQLIVTAILLAYAIFGTQKLAPRSQADPVIRHSVDSLLADFQARHLCGVPR